jgi:hypothetical protein
MKLKKQSRILCISLFALVELFSCTPAELTASSNALSILSAGVNGLSVPSSSATSATASGSSGSLNDKEYCVIHIQNKNAFRNLCSVKINVYFCQLLTGGSFPCDGKFPAWAGGIEIPARSEAAFSFYSQDKLYALKIAACEYPNYAKRISESSYVCR